MKRNLILLIAAIMMMSLSIFSQSSDKAGKKQFIILLKLNKKWHKEKNWSSKDNAAIGEHFKKLQALQKEGKLIIAGRTTVAKSMGIVVLEVADEAEARKVMENDDAIKAGIMSAELFPFSVALMKIMKE